MKFLFVRIVVLVITVTQGYTYPLDYYHTPVCAFFKGYYKTFASVQALMREIRLTGSYWCLIKLMPCEAIFDKCTNEKIPICAYSEVLDTFRTFINECQMNKEIYKTKIIWKATFPFGCPTIEDTEVKETTTKKYYTTSGETSPHKNFTPCQSDLINNAIQQNVSSVGFYATTPGAEETIKTSTEEQITNSAGDAGTTLRGHESTMSKSTTSTNGQTIEISPEVLGEENEYETVMPLTTETITCEDGSYCEEKLTSFGTSLVGGGQDSSSSDITTSKTLTKQGTTIETTPSANGATETEEHEIETMHPSTKQICEEGSSCEEDLTWTSSAIHPGAQESSNSDIVTDETSGEQRTTSSDIATGTTLVDEEIGTTIEDLGPTLIGRVNTTTLKATTSGGDATGTTGEEHETTSSSEITPEEYEFELSTPPTTQKICEAGSNCEEIQTSTSPTTYPGGQETSSFEISTGKTSSIERTTSPDEAIASTRVVPSDEDLKITAHDEGTTGSAGDTRYTAEGLGTTLMGGADITTSQETTSGGDSSGTAGEEEETTSSSEITPEEYEFEVSTSPTTQKICKAGSNCEEGQTWASPIPHPEAQETSSSDISTGKTATESIFIEEETTISSGVLKTTVYGQETTTSVGVTRSTPFAGSVTTTSSQGDGSTNIAEEGENNTSLGEITPEEYKFEVSISPTTGNICEAGSICVEGQTGASPASYLAEWEIISSDISTGKASSVQITTSPIEATKSILVEKEITSSGSGLNARTTTEGLDTTTSHETTIGGSSGTAGEEQEITSSSEIRPHDYEFEVSISPTIETICEAGSSCEEGQTWTSVATSSSEISVGKTSSGQRTKNCVEGIGSTTLEEEIRSSTAGLNTTGNYHGAMNSTNATKTTTEGAATPNLQGQGTHSVVTVTETTTSTTELDCSKCLNGTKLCPTGLLKNVPTVVINSQSVVHNNHNNTYNGPYAEGDFYHQPVHNHYNIIPVPAVAEKVLSNSVSNIFYGFYPIPGSSPSIFNVMKNFLSKISPNSNRENSD